jgi:hypothetical protein
MDKVQKKKHFYRPWLPQFAWLHRFPWLLGVGESSVITSSPSQTPQPRKCHWPQTTLTSLAPFAKVKVCPTRQNCSRITLTIGRDRQARSVIVMMEMNELISAYCHLYSTSSDIKVGDVSRVGYACTWKGVSKQKVPGERATAAGDEPWHFKRSLVHEHTDLKFLR